MRSIFLSIVLSVLSAITLNVSAQKIYQSDNVLDNPSIKIHDTIASPGELLLQIDALNFTVDNGSVAAITLRIEIDTALIEFQGIQNTTLAGSWLSNYNYILNEITILYTAPFGVGNDLNGKLLDLNLIYYGGFKGELNFNANCEISNNNLQTISGVVYENGSINPTNPVGKTNQDSVSVVSEQLFQMPIIAQGSGFNAITEVYYRINYDTLALEYLGNTNSLIEGATVEKNLDVLNIEWNDDANPKDLTMEDTLLFLDFQYIGEENTMSSFLTGSYVKNNGVIVSSEFQDGNVRVLYSVDLLNQPDTAGTSNGDGPYFIEDVVTLSAVAETGFSFENWSQSGNTVSTENHYSFVKQIGNETFSAHFTANSYDLTLLSSPEDGGETTGAGTYIYGESPSVKAIASEGHEFLNWMLNDEIVSEDAEYIFFMPPTDIELTANFGLLNYTITASPNNPNFGSISGGGVYDYGSTASLTATAATGYVFVNWSEGADAVSFDPIYIFIVENNRNLIANFISPAICSSPVGLFADNLDETEALLNWLPSGDELEWDLIWGEMGFETNTAGNLLEGLTETSYQLENLDPGISYDFYVRGVCYDDLNSSWAGPHTFSTWFVGIEDKNSKNEFVVFPNPATHQLIISSETAIKLNPKYSVVNLNGIKILNGEMNNHKTQIDISNLIPGIYFIIIFNEEIVDHHKFIKQ